MTEITYTATDPGYGPLTVHDDADILCGHVTLGEDEEPDDGLKRCGWERVGPWEGFDEQGAEAIVVRS